MPNLPSVQPSSGGTPFRAVLGAVLGRLRIAFPNAGFVRLIANPEERIPQYKAEDGIAVYVETPRPKPVDGAGRYGRNTFRDIVVFVLTQNLLDEAGSDEQAVLNHVDREEIVSNTLEQTPPPTEPYANTIGILCTWVEGGEDIVRQMKIDPGMLVSALRFRINYQTPMRVYRQ